MGTTPIYVFRGLVSAGDTVVSAAPIGLVTAVYGDGGHIGEGGLFAAFSGGAVFKNDDTGALYLGVWGARNASRFRTALRRTGMSLKIVREHPPARLMFISTKGKRSPRR